MRVLSVRKGRREEEEMTNERVKGWESSAAAR
jgi:hypothetical protein